MKPIRIILSKKQHISNDDLDILCELIKTDIALHDALDIVKTSNNKQIIKSIVMRLDRGETVNEVFVDYLGKEIRKYFMSFISYLSFKDSLSLSITMLRKEKNLKGKIIKEISYPMILMVVTLSGIFLFNRYCFDTLIMTVSEFNADIASAVLFKRMLDICIDTLFVAVCIILITILFFMHKKRIVFAYIMLDRYMPNSIFKEYLSSRFVLYFNECHKTGLKTKDSIDILKSFHFEPLVSFIAFHVDTELLSGKNMIEAMKNKYIDDRLSRFIKIAINTSELNMMLDGYIMQFEKRFKKYIKKLSLGIQLTSYILVGIVIIFVYQILFIPMSMIGGL